MTLNIQTVFVTPLRQNCTIVSHSNGRAFIVDPGGESDRLFQAVAQYDVEAILLTHGHLDHAGGAKPLSDLLKIKQGKNVPIVGPGYEDEFLLHSITQQAELAGTSGMISVTPDRYLEDGDVLYLLGRPIHVAHIPGHTPGHMVFIDHDEKRAIVGDTLFRGTVGRTDFAYGNTQQLLNGIREKLLSLPDDVVVLCGHGLPTTIGEERRTNPFFKS